MITLIYISTKLNQKFNRQILDVQTDEKRPTKLEMISNPKVICLGEALVDRLGPLGEDPAKSQIDRCENKLGGAPANVACALARLGTPTAFIGRLGHDEFGEAFEGC